MAAAHPVVTSGELTVLRLVDIAYSIDLVQAERLWTAHANTAFNRSYLSSTPPKAVAFGVAPLWLSLGEVHVPLADGPVRAAVSVRLYDFGVATLSLRAPCTDRSWPDYVKDVATIDAQFGPSARTSFWDDLLARVHEVIRPALDRPAEGERLDEDYLIATVQAFDEPMDAETLKERLDLTEVLSGETRPLSRASRKELLSRNFSYYADDLVVLNWDRAFVYEPRSDSDVADVIEVANAQLVELRYYDILLDNELPRMYDQVENARTAASLFASRRFAHLARRLYTLVAEVTELTERVDNALQVTEDVYLARVYSTALSLFRVPALSASVDRKLAIVRDTYAALYDEASSRRAELLEIAIVVLIIVEIGISLLHA
ncbi:hypothetical protein [Luteibacter sp. RCC_6_2]|jgi:hypothetical protein|uniref:hypothetical protein n=1 Tax=Luteibacter sp. RCC_6_2 TaxID=3239223 RepID=UPI003525ABD5